MSAKKNEEKRILNCIPSRDIEKDWSETNAVQAGLQFVRKPVPTFDLRDDSWWKIGDQGSTGSCVGWASTDAVLRWHLVKVGKLAKNQFLSVRFTWMASKETDEYTSYPETFIDEVGTSLKSALTIQKNFGSVLDSLLPFSGGLVSGSEKTFFATAATRKINSYFNLISTNNDQLTTFRNWISHNGPILVRLDVDKTWDSVTSNGILSTYNPSSTRGGHAVALVGYDQNQFIVRNSWGTAWGDKGYAYASNAYTLAAFTEAYGISV